MRDGRSGAAKGGIISRSVVLVAILVLLVQVPVEAGSISVIRSGPRASGGVALTFDDGWGAESCERIVKILRREQVTATFFINGVHLRADPARWRRILKGFPVANHTRSHPDLSTAPESQIRKQIRTNENIHRQVLGRPMLKVLRPPYGAYDKQVTQVARELGYRYVVLWSRTAADTSLAATTKSIIRHTTGAPRGTIILMHCARGVTVDALPAVIRSYKRRGIPLIGLDEMLGMGKTSKRDPLPYPSGRGPSQPDATSVQPDAMTLQPDATTSWDAPAPWPGATTPWPGATIRF